jgi:putative FmdB family regulatory protein
MRYVGAFKSRGEAAMPIYEYQCAKCGHQLEVLQKVSDEPLLRCDACGENALSKLISATNFQLKGSGWYKAAPTDTSAPKGDVPKTSEGSSAVATSGESKGSGDSAGSDATSTSAKNVETASSPSVNTSSPAVNGASVAKPKKDD